MSTQERIQAEWIHCLKQRNWKRWSLGQAAGCPHPSPLHPPAEPAPSLEEDNALLVLPSSFAVSPGHMTQSSQLHLRELLWGWGNGMRRIMGKSCLKWKKRDVLDKRFPFLFHWIPPVNTTCLEMEQFGNIPERLTEIYSEPYILSSWITLRITIVFGLNVWGGMGVGRRKFIFKLLSRLSFYYSSQIILSKIKIWMVWELSQAI